MSKHTSTQFFIIQTNSQIFLLNKKRQMHYVVTKCSNLDWFKHSSLLLSKQSKSNPQINQSMDDIVVVKIGVPKK